MILVGRCGVCVYDIHVQCVGWDVHECYMCILWCLDMVLVCVVYMCMIYVGGVICIRFCVWISVWYMTGVWCGVYVYDISVWCDMCVHRGDWGLWWGVGVVDTRECVDAYFPISTCRSQSRKSSFFLSLSFLPRCKISN